MSDDTGINMHLAPAKTHRLYRSGTAALLALVVMQLPGCVTNKSRTEAKDRAVLAEADTIDRAVQTAAA